MVSHPSSCWDLVMGTAMAHCCLCTVCMYSCQPAFTYSVTASPDLQCYTD